MGFLKLVDKKKVPDELPALITEEIKKRPEETEAQDVKKDIKQEVQDETSPEIEKNNIQSKEISQPKPIQLPENQVKQDTTPVNQIKLEGQGISEEKTNEEKGYSRLLKDSFFINLQENLNKEMDSLNKLEEWYNNKLLPEDTLSEMKNYWEKQKSNSMIQILGKDFQDKITKKIILLQELEKSWQDTYFNLMEKEEKIKEQEKELKKMLAEFIGFCKKRVENEKINEKKENRNEKTKDKKEPNKKRKSR